MRVVVQRVTEASVEVEGSIVGKIGKGLLVLVAFCPGDDAAAMQWMASKLVGLRIFEDERERMNLALAAVGGRLLLVPQFTLYGDCRRGRRPSFTQALAPEAAHALFDDFCQLVTSADQPPARGIFGAHMRVALVNDGPVTLVIDSPPNTRSADASREAPEASQSKQD